MQDKEPKHQARLEILNSEDHAQVTVATDSDAKYGDAVMQVMAFPFEFRNLQAFYPIFFQVDGNSDFYPLALLGFEEGENLFLDAPNWRCGYKPAMLERGPFLVGVKDVPGQQEQARVLSIDMQHPRVNADQGVALFNSLGGRSDYLEEQANLLETLHDGLGHCQRFCQALQEYELLEAVTLEITLNDGTKNQLIGLSGIDEDKVKALPASVLEAFSQKGYLMPLYMVIASMSNVQTLIDLKNAKVMAGP